MIVEALILGLVTNLHCVGMCGPLALALPDSSTSTMQKIGGRALYNIGRVTTYSALGVVVGFLGAGIDLTGFQEWVSIVSGAAMVVFALHLLFGFALFPALDGAISKRVRSPLQRLFRSKSMPALYGIGILNGLLPCGMVYIALALALNSTTVVEGVFTMAAFGVGTIPAMFAMSMASTTLPTTWRSKLNKLIPIATLLIGSVLVMRGMALNIPFISPVLNAHQPAASSCCDTP